MHPTLHRLLEIRRDQLRQWLDEHAPEVFEEQLHTRRAHDRTPESVYWHYGYYQALRDVLAWEPDES